MGLFKKTREAMKMMPEVASSAFEMKAQAEQMNAEAAKMMSGEVDPSALEPIEGIDLNTYAKIAKMQAEGGLVQEEFEAWLASQGITPKQSAMAQAGWLARMRDDMGLMTRYGTIYQHTSVD